MSLIPDGVKGWAYGVSLLPAALLDWLFGPKCDLCGERVLPNDLQMHCLIHHAGDRP